MNHLKTVDDKNREIERKYHKEHIKSGQETDSLCLVCSGEVKMPNNNSKSSKQAKTGQNEDVPVESQNNNGEDWLEEDWI